MTTARKTLVPTIPSYGMGLDGVRQACFRDKPVLDFTNRPPATAPSRLYKAYTTEGGVRVPCITRFPGFRNKDIADTFSTVMDICPTILEMAGIQHPAPTYQGREVVPMRGTSMLPWLSGHEDRVHEKDFIQGWELCGRGAIRKANWKAVFIPKPKGPEVWQLYDLSKDPGEIQDLAEEHPRKLEELLGHWETYVQDCGVVPLQPELGTYIVATEEQMPVSLVTRGF